MNTRFLTLSLSALLTASALAEPASGVLNADGFPIRNLKDANLELINNHDPASELENFTLLDGFEANLFASEPMIANPVHMTWDARGRLWVACSWAYPQLEPGDEANDKIIILEDTDGDGRADKSTVFADGLYMPIGIMLANGGAYVAQTPEVVFLKDTDGDDVADFKEVALTGFGIEDSHHSISAWRRGPAGWIYFQEGIFLHTQIETQYGMVRNYNGGVYQFNPRTQELRVFANLGVGNPWGHVIDRWGQNFMVDNPRVNYLTASSGASTEKVRAHTLIKTEKQCGGDLASGSHLPPEMLGQLMSGRFKGRKVIRYEFTENESGFSASVLPPLLESAHPNFRPVDVKVGPDGAVYVADWYNSIINHAQHDFRDPRRDHNHGRIWRITHKDRPLVDRPNLVDAELPELLDNLKSPDHWTRHYSRLVLSEKFDRDEVANALRSWIDQLDPADENYDHHLLEALWTFQNVERIDEPTLLQVLNSKTGQARAAGARTLRYWHEQIADPVALIEKLANDPFPRVRLEAILTAGYLFDAQALPAALQALDHPTDEFIDDALTQTVAALADQWVPAFNAGELAFASPEHEALATQQAGLGTEKRLAQILKNRQASPDELRSVTQQLVTNPSTAQVRLIGDTLSKNFKSFPPDLVLELLGAVRTVGLNNKMGGGSNLSPLAEYLDSDNDELVIAILGSLGSWRRPDAAPVATKILNDPRRSPEVRQVAARTLGEIGQRDSLDSLHAMAGSNQPTETRYLAALGLAAGDLDDAAAVTAEIFTIDPANNDPVSLLTAFIQRDKGARTLASALDGKEVHPAVIAAIGKQVRKSGQLPRDLATILQPASSSSLSATLLAEKPAQLVADVANLGDPAHGELIYRRPGLACTACHAISGVGQKIGPDLAAVGAAATADYIVESILEPNKAIAEHYENYAITTESGGFHMGSIAFQSEDEVALHDATQPGGERLISRDQIKKMTTIPSLMPPNLADQLADRQEFLDLASFVSQLGRSGPYASSDAPVLRTWKLLPAGSADATPASIPTDAAWLPAFSLVQGNLPADHLALAPQLFARASVDVQSPGPVTLDINHPKALSLWINGKKVKKTTAPIKLSKGPVTLTFLIDQSQRPGLPLRVELKTPPNSKAKYQIQNNL